MNDDLTTGTVTLTDSGDYAIVTDNGLVPMTASSITMPVNGGGVSVSSPFISNIAPSVWTPAEDLLDQFELNRVAVDHKITEQELLKLKEVAPDYASEIKENIAKNLARDISKKIHYTKKHDKNTDVHHFIGRVWVFTDEELKAILEKR